MRQYLDMPILMESADRRPRAMLRNLKFAEASYGDCPYLVGW